MTMTSATMTMTIKSQPFHDFVPIPIPTKITHKSLSFNPMPNFPRKSPAMATKWHTFKVFKANHINHSLDKQVPPPLSQAKSGETKGITGGAASIGVAAAVAAAAIAVVIIINGDDKAWALGPEGPLVEEFWENVRRYALYALTVSTGVIYAVFQPIVELLKNPISAVLVLIIIGGSIFIVSQILSAMVGVSDFSYEYYY